MKDGRALWSGDVELEAGFCSVQASWSNASRPGYVEQVAERLALSTKDGP